jgi:WD40 repeat protein
MTTRVEDTPEGPYVGIFPFDESTRAFFFGRDREARDLFNLLVAQRAVLLHAPSGAGKTSLIQAALVPALRKARFEVAPIIRVGLEPEEAGPRLDPNRYLSSVLRSLSGPDRSPSARDDAGSGSGFPARLARLLAERPWIADGAGSRRRGSGERVIIFDQFEEILTADPVDLDAKRAFFEQVGVALRDPGLWALFAIREDYAASLEPYLPAIPNRLSATFRLDFLSRDAARDAIVRPAREFGVTFEPDAVDRVIADLARIQVMDLEGRPLPKDGPYVEPLHLQVVCESLWRARTAPDRITADDLERLAHEVGDDLHGVTAALARYYNTTVRETARLFQHDGVTHDGVTERSIRNWFEQALISPSGLRLSVLLGTEKDYQLTPAVLKALANRYLVRPERRHGGIYYELAHDRLAEPVLKSNAAWRRANPGPIGQDRAKLWDDVGRPDHLLLRGSELDEAERSVGGPSEVSSLEWELLQASRSARARAEERRQQELKERRLSALLGMQRGRAYFEEGEAGTGMLCLAKSLNDLPPGQADLERIIRTQLSGWRQEVHELRQQLTHRGQVRAVAFAPGGDVVATGSDDATAQLWQAATGECIGDPLKHGGPVRSVAFSRDGRALVTSSLDGTARLWDAATGRPIGDPMEHTEAVHSVAFSRDGRTVLTGSEDGTVRLWDATGGRPLPRPAKAIELRGQDRPIAIYVAAFSPDDRLILTGSFDESARLWDAATGEPSCGPMKHEGQVRFAAFSPNGRYIVTGSDGTARLWDAATGDPAGKAMVHQGNIWAVTFSPTGESVLTASEDGTARVWAVPTGEPIGRRLEHRGAVRSGAFSPCGRYIITGSFDNTARLWDAATGAPVGAPMKCPGPVWGVAFSPRGDSVLVGSIDDTARLWAVRSGPLAGTILQHDGPVNVVAFAPDGRTVATGSNDATARLWDARTGRPIGDPLKHGGKVSAVAFSPDSQAVVTGGDDATARLWSFRSGRPRLCMAMIHESAVRVVAFSHDGRTIFTGTYEGRARLWDVATGAPLCDPLVHDGPVWAVAFSPNDRMAVTGCERDGVHRWDARSGASLDPTLVHDGPVWAVAFSPDGRTILTGSDDRRARLWGAETGELLDESFQHWAEVRAVAYGPEPDGQVVLTGSFDNSARLWSTSGKPLCPPLDHRGPVHRVAFSPVGGIAVTASDDHTARLWDVGRLGDAADGQRAGLMLSQLLHQGAVRRVAFSPDGRTVLTGSRDGTARLWRVPVPIEGDVDRITLWTQVITGMELDEWGTIRFLDGQRWREYRERLQGLGGPPS